ncbi:hypothetical protein AAFN87_07590 [Solibacillus sp. CAU 1738]
MVLHQMWGTNFEELKFIAPFMNGGVDFYSSSNAFLGHGSN